MQNSSTYVPSARREEGTTRSSVDGSRMIPEVVLSGFSNGFDMFEIVGSGKNWREIDSGSTSADEEDDQIREMQWSDLNRCKIGMWI